MLGTGGILALVLFIAAALGTGLALGGRDPRDRSVMGLGTAQRNISAAIVVAAQNFTDPNVIVMLLVGAILLLLVLMATARQLAGRSQAAAVPAAIR
jgi:BASS family bile acid:Na+ symporter